MRNSLLIGLGLAICASLFSCKSNYICPSFESAYILDNQIRNQTFSLFDEDSLPRDDFQVRKNKYGVIKSIKYRKKRDEMLTVKMETIFPQVEPPDTLLLAEQDLSPEDMEQLLKEGERPVNHYNVDQIYYMRHFGQYLPMPEEPGVRETAPQEEEIELEEPQTKKKRKKWQFWKKKELVEESDSVNTGFEEYQEEEPIEQDLNKKERRRLEQQEKERQEEIEQAKQPVIMDLDDFEKNRGQTDQENEGLFEEDQKRKAKPKKGKKIRLGIRKKKKRDNSIEVIEEDQ